MDIGTKVSSTKLLSYLLLGDKYGELLRQFSSLSTLSLTAKLPWTRQVAHAHRSLALLEFQRNRWGAALDDLRRSVLSFTDACGIDVRDHLRSLLPQVAETFIDRTLSLSESGLDDRAAQSLEPRECDPVHEAVFVSGWDLENLESVLSPLAFSELPFIGLG